MENVTARTSVHPFSKHYGRYCKRTRTGSAKNHSRRTSLRQGLNAAHRSPARYIPCPVGRPWRGPSQYEPYSRNTSPLTAKRTRPKMLHNRCTSLCRNIQEKINHLFHLHVRFILHYYTARNLDSLQWKTRLPPSGRRLTVRVTVCVVVTVFRTVTDVNIVPPPGAEVIKQEHADERPGVPPGRPIEMIWRFSSSRFRTGSSFGQVAS